MSGGRDEGEHGALVWAVVGFVDVEVSGVQLPEPQRVVRQVDARLYADGTRITTYLDPRTGEVQIKMPVSGCGGCPLEAARPAIAPEQWARAFLPAPVFIPPAPVVAYSAEDGPTEQLGVLEL